MIAIPCPLSFLQSFPRKCAFLDVVAAAKYDLYFFTETWLKSHHFVPAMLSKWIEEYAIVRCDRSRRAGGGVAMFIRKTLNYSTVISESVPSGYEIAVDVALPDPCIRIVPIYRPPSSPPSINEQLGKLVSDLAAVSIPVLVVGDFNIPEFDWVQWNNIRDISHPLFDTFATHGFKQYVDHPTRGNNLLDLLFSNDEELIRDVSVKSPIGHSDHFCVSFKITGRSIPCTPVFKRLRSKSLLTHLKLHGRLLVNDLEKANALASEFDKVFQQDNNCLPLYSPNVTNQVLTFPYFDANDIYNLLKNWPCSSSVTPDQVPFEFVQEYCSCYCLPL
ncbi:endonuclease/exonuclease/phosphatase family protein, partial [Ostertagia ostertagi]